MNIRPSDLSPLLTISVETSLPESWPSAARPGNEHCYIFQTREFIEAWLHSFGAKPTPTPYFVTVRGAGGQPVMQLPLCIERRRGARVLTFIDQGHADYNAPIMLAPQTWTEPEVRALWARILAAVPKLDAVRLEKMPAMIAGIRNPLHVLAAGLEMASTHGNRLDVPWADVERGLYSPKEVRKNERALAKLAAVEFVAVTEPEQRAVLIERLIEQKQHRFEETRVPGFAENPEALAFLKAATEVFARSGNLLLCALMVGGEAAAIQWALVQDKTAYALVTSFASGPWSRFACGRILNYQLLKWLHERGFTYFDQCFGDEPYKLKSTDTSTALWRAEVDITRVGWLYLTREHLLARARQSWLGCRLRPLKWVVLRSLRRSGVAG